MEKDLFSKLDKELAGLQGSIVQDVQKVDIARAEIVRSVLEYCWNFWIRFDRIKVHFVLEPSPGVFASFQHGKYPDEWSFKEGFDFSAVSEVSLTDKTQAEGRTGDSIKVWFYNVEKTVHLRMVFQYCDGEHYYKYSGWKRIFAQNILYDQPVSKVKVDKLWEVMADVVKVWYESHLRRNRELLIKHIKANYEQGETFTD